MAIGDGIESIDDEELLYRKIPVSTGWVDSLGGLPLSPQAFHPQRFDSTGISLDRAKYRTIIETAQVTSPDGYYVAVLRAGDLKANGIVVRPDPIDGNIRPR